MPHGDGFAGEKMPSSAKLRHEKLLVFQWILPFLRERLPEKRGREMYLNRPAVTSAAYFFFFLDDPESLLSLLPPSTPSSSPPRSCWPPEDFVLALFLSPPRTLPRTPPMFC